MTFMRSQVEAEGFEALVAGGRHIASICIRGAINDCISIQILIHISDCILNLCLPQGLCFVITKA